MNECINLCFYRSDNLCICFFLSDGMPKQNKMKKKPTEQKFFCFPIFICEHMPINWTKSSSSSSSTLYLWIIFSFDYLDIFLNVFHSFNHSLYWIIGYQCTTTITTDTTTIYIKKQEFFHFILFHSIKIDECRYILESVCVFFFHYLCEKMMIIVIWCFWYDFFFRSSCEFPDMKIKTEQKNIIIIYLDWSIGFKCLILSCFVLFLMHIRIRLSGICVVWAYKRKKTTIIIDILAFKLLSIKIWNLKIQICFHHHHHHNGCVNPFFFIYEMNKKNVFKIENSSE